MHCWCPPATGPNQPHEKDCVQYKRPWQFSVKYHPAPTTIKMGSEWSEAHKVSAPLTKEAVHAVYAGLDVCTCAAKVGVIGHAAFCPLGVKDVPDDPGPYDPADAAL